MSTLGLQEAELSTTADDFGALEQRVLRAVELVKTERAARTQAEQNVERLQREAEEQAVVLAQAQEQLRMLEQEREQVRQRVERLLKQLDEVAS
jgi:chromosome segregation ATPase